MRTLDRAGVALAIVAVHGRAPFAGSFRYLVQKGRDFDVWRIGSTSGLKETCICDPGSGKGEGFTFKDVAKVIRR